MAGIKNIEIERKYFGTHFFEQDEIECIKYKTSVSHDRYYTCPSGLIRLRDDEEKGLEFTAKNYLKNNLKRREVNLSIPSFTSLDDCLEFAEVAGWSLRLEFKQQLQIWITHTACISQTLITDINDKPYRFDKQNMFITYHEAFPQAQFVEIEAIDPETTIDGINSIQKIQCAMGLSQKEIVKYSLVQLFGAFPR